MEWFGRRKQKKRRKEQSEMKRKWMATAMGARGARKTLLINICRWILHLRFFACFAESSSLFRWLHVQATRPTAIHVRAPTSIQKAHICVQSHNEWAWPSIPPVCTWRDSFVLRCYSRRRAVSITFLFVFAPCVCCIIAEIKFVSYARNLINMHRMWMGHRAQTMDRTPNTEHRAEILLP